MSWWTKNRKKVGIAAGLLGGGALMAASGGTASGLLGLLPEFMGGTAAAGTGAGAATGATVVGATTDVAAAEAAREAAMAGLSQIPQGLGTATSLGKTGYSVGGGLHAATGGLLSGAGGGGGTTMAMMGANMLNQSQPQQQMTAPPPPPPQSPPGPSFAGYGDPMAGMDEEKKRKLLAMLQSQRGFA